MTKFYLDENISREVAFLLNRAGLWVSTCHDAGMQWTKDEEQLQYAISHGFVLVTGDRDFCMLHETASEHSGIVRHSRGLRPREMSERLIALAEANHDFSNRLTTLKPEDYTVGIRGCPEQHFHYPHSIPTRGSLTLANVLARHMSPDLAQKLGCCS